MIDRGQLSHIITQGRLRDQAREKVMKTVVFAGLFGAIVLGGASRPLAQNIGALQVFDSQGRVLGRYFPVAPGCGTDCSAAAIVTPTYSALLPLTPKGFTLITHYRMHLPSIVHLSSDCSGPRFMMSGAQDNAGFFPPPALLTAAKLMVPLAPAVVGMMFNSREVFSDGPEVVDWSQPGTCAAAQTNDTAYFLVTIDAAAVATPPFSIR
jgi:hypothetical protein